MGTRSIIGYRETAIKWKGVFHHWDGYPRGVGVTLLKLAKTKGIDFIKREIVDSHVSGWSTINGNWKLKPRACSNSFEEEESKRPPEYWEYQKYCQFYTEKDLPGTGGTEYLYLITKKGAIQVYICKYVKGKFTGNRMIGMFGMGAPDIGQGENVKWVKLGELDPATATAQDMKKLEK